MTDDDWKDDLRAIREVLNPRDEGSSYTPPKATLRDLGLTVAFTVGCVIGGFTLRALSGYDGDPTDPILLVLMALLAGALGGGLRTLWLLVRLMFGF